MKLHSVLSVNPHSLPSPHRIIFVKPIRYTVCGLPSLSGVGVPPPTTFRNHLKQTRQIKLKGMSCIMNQILPSTKVPKRICDEMSHRYDVLMYFV